MNHYTVENPALTASVPSLAEIISTLLDLESSYRNQGNTTTTELFNRVYPTASEIGTSLEFGAQTN